MKANIGTLNVNFTESDIQEMLSSIKDTSEHVFTWTFPLEESGNLVTINITVGEDDR